ncbi:EI24 domain-containing protein [Microbacterium radiodurans]|uniref:EI24 domain-containing protein n=1 Tax=Microbacterium radiodurans TaxID=661398 RepID=A0A5J5ITI5_9MICO|nr:EI24 domain-containing protein [Microbacterium radiodurans]KAA9089208.1 EI24 domain-containing protein [Microbacterium radiodurans]
MTQPSPAPGALPAFLGGAATLARGFGFWARRPRLMAWGLIPAAIVGVVLLAALMTLAVFLTRIVDAVTPFADAWSEPWASIVRFASGTALLGGGVVLAVVSFTALTLIVGEPFYDRIWRAAESVSGATPPQADYGFWRSVRDGVGLVLRGLVAALVAALLGLVPLAGGALGAVTAVTLTGWLLADELTTRALSARGIDARERRRLRRAQRSRVLGFGVATQLCFLVPLGAVITMPAAIAGSTMLAHTLLEGRVRANADVAP